MHPYNCPLHQQAADIYASMPPPLAKAYRSRANEQRANMERSRKKKTIVLVPVIVQAAPTELYCEGSQCKTKIAEGLSCGSAREGFGGPVSQRTSMIYNPMSGYRHYQMQYPVEYPRL